MNQDASEQTTTTVFDFLERPKNSSFIVLRRVQKEDFLFIIKALNNILAGIHEIIGLGRIDQKAFAYYQLFYAALCSPCAEDFLLQAGLPPTATKDVSQN